MKDNIIIWLVAVSIVIGGLDLIFRQDVKTVIKAQASEEVQKAIETATDEELVTACYTPKIWPLLVEKYNSDNVAQATTTNQ